MKRYEYLEHTGDIGIRAYGGTLEELFINAAQGLLETIADLGTVGTTTETEIEVSAESLEDLMVAWLDELNFRHEVEEIFCRRNPLKT
jgi:SHS2 domain-containing protein